MNIPKIVIHTDLDLTPAGKRTARVVSVKRGTVLRWYVGGRIFRSLAVNEQNKTLTQSWLCAQPN